MVGILFNSFILLNYICKTHSYAVTVYPFSFQYNIPMCAYTMYSSILLLRAVWVVSSLRPLSTFMYVSLIAQAQEFF